MIDAFALGDKVVMRKPHACGANEWQIIRTGADVKIKCLQCGRIVMLDRAEFVKRAKKIINTEENEA
ncbi:MAG: DUF951 domain-containing protein [Eubacteriales bacterium]|nr:DUF951 domain-containing protein [Eubacteriales bacterium]